MRVSFVTCLLVGVIAAPAFAETAAKEEVKWTCTKDGKALEVTGADTKEKQKSCQSQGGAWKKEKAAAEATKQSSGGGGGW